MASRCTAAATTGAFTRCGSAAALRLAFELAVALALGDSADPNAVPVEEADAAEARGGKDGGAGTRGVKRAATSLAAAATTPRPLAPFPAAAAAAALLLFALAPCASLMIKPGPSARPLASG